MHLLLTVKRTATQRQQFTGTSGGTYSATPSGLSINASTGAIDLDASIMGTYAVKYVTSSSICADSTTFNITLTATNTVLVNGGFDVSTATYVQDFSVGSQDGSPHGLVFNNDGTKMFIVGYQYDHVYEYLLSTPYDVSSATYAGNAERFYVGAQETYPVGLEFNNDGTKMYVIGDSGNDINEYNLLTAFDVSSATYAGNSERLVIPTSYDSQPQSLTFSDDGTKLFVVGWADNVLEYTLATAYDVSSATYAGNAERYNVGSQEGSARSIAFNNDGTKMFITGSASDIIHEYTLATAYDVSTSTYAGASESFLISEDISPVSVVFNNTGTKMYVLGAGNDKVYEYSLDNPASPTVCINDAITNITFNTTGATGIGTPTNLPTGLTAAWSSNVLTISGTPTVAGTYAYSVPLTGGCGTVAATGTITVLPTESAAFSYASATYCETDSDPSPTVTGTSGGTFSATPSGLSINASTGAIDLSASTMGTYAVKYVTSSSICADSTTFNVTLTATNTLIVNGAYDISTATFVQDFSVSAQDGTPKSISFNNDGTKMYILGDADNDVNEYNLIYCL